MYVKFLSRTNFLFEVNYISAYEFNSTWCVQASEDGQFHDMDTQSDAPEVCGYIGYDNETNGLYI